MRKASYKLNRGRALINYARSDIAITFRDWFFNNAIPSLKVIRQVGYQFIIRTEYDLHNGVVYYIRNRYPGAIMFACCGENQDTPSKRIMPYGKKSMKGTYDL